LLTPFMVKMYCDMGAPQGDGDACGAGAVKGFRDGVDYPGTGCSMPVEWL
jgi:hypothetical protein